MNLCYVNVTHSDVPVIFAQAKNLIDTYEDLASIDYDRVMNWVEKKITAHICDYRAVQQNGKTCAYYRLTADGELDDFYVLPGYRCQGIGSEILKKVLADSKSPVYLYVFSRNTRAIALYARFGFTVRESIGKTRLIMERKG